MAHRQVIEFTHYLLPEEAWLAPETVWNTLRGPDSTAWLTALWAQAYQYAYTPEPPRPPTGLLAEQCLAGTHEAVLIGLPPPAAAPEAWYALLVRTPGGAAPFRYFMLETTAPPAAPHPADAPATDALAAAAPPTPTLIGERQADADLHHAHGAGPLAPTRATVPQFLVAVGRLLAPPPPPARPLIPGVTTIA